MLLQQIQRPSRRRFLREAAAATNGLVAAPYVITSTALGGEGRPPASERIVIGGIGLGGRGTSDLKWMLQEPEVQFVAVCDAAVDDHEPCDQHLLGAQT